MGDSTEVMADVISIILSPPVIAMLATMVFTLASPIGLGSLDLFSSVFSGVLLLSVVPITLPLYFAKRGVTDLDVSNREMRTPFYLVAIFSYLIACLLFFITQCQVMFALSAAYLCTTSAVATINLRWKISSHSAGVGGPITAIVYVFGLKAMSLFLLVPVIIWARMRLGVHDLKQATAGVLTAMVITFFVYFVLFP